jgi:hypothetical protein
MLNACRNAPAKNIHPPVKRGRTIPAPFFFWTPPSLPPPPPARPEMSCPHGGRAFADSVISPHIHIHEHTPMQQPNNDDDDNLQHEGLDDLPLEMWESVLASTHPACRQSARLVCQTWTALTPKPTMRLRAFGPQSIGQSAQILLVADTEEEMDRALVGLVALIREAFGVVAMPRALCSAPASTAVETREIESIEDTERFVAEAKIANGTRKWLFVMDGSISVRSHEPAVRELFFNGRHWGMSSIMVATSREKIPAAIRHNFSHIVVCPTRHGQFPLRDLIESVVLFQLGGDVLRTVVAAMENDRRLLALDLRNNGGGLSAFFLSEG